VAFLAVKSFLLSVPEPLELQSCIDRDSQRRLHSLNYYKLIEFNFQRQDPCSWTGLLPDDETTVHHAVKI